jgi:hypothetical protein
VGDATRTGDPSSLSLPYAAANEANDAMNEKEKVMGPRLSLSIGLLFQAD